MFGLSFKPGALVDDEALHEDVRYNGRPEHREFDEMESSAMALIEKYDSQGGAAQAAKKELAKSKHQEKHNILKQARDAE